MDKNAYAQLEQGKATDTKMPALDSSSLWESRTAVVDSPKVETSKADLNRLGLPDLQLTQEPAGKPKENVDEKKPAAAAVFAMPERTAVAEKLRDALPDAATAPHPTELRMRSEDRMNQTEGVTAARAVSSEARSYDKPTPGVSNEAQVVRSKPTSDYRDVAPGNDKSSSIFSNEVQVARSKPISEYQGGNDGPSSILVNDARQARDVVKPAEKPSMDTWSAMENHDLRQTDYVAERQRLERPSFKRTDERLQNVPAEKTGAPLVQEGVAASQFDRPASERKTDTVVVPDAVKRARVQEERRYEREYERPGSGYSDDELPRVQPDSAPKSNGPDLFDYPPEPSAMLSAEVRDINSSLVSQLREPNPIHVVSNVESMLRDTHSDHKAPLHKPEHGFYDVDSLLRDVDSSLKGFGQFGRQLLSSFGEALRSVDGKHQGREHNPWHVISSVDGLQRNVGDRHRVRHQNPWHVISSVDALQREFGERHQVNRSNSWNVISSNDALLRNVDEKRNVREEYSRQLLDNLYPPTSDRDVWLEKSDRVVLDARLTKQADLADGASQLTDYGYGHNFPHQENPWQRSAREAREDADVLNRHFAAADTDIDDRITREELQSYIKRLETETESATGSDWLDKKFDSIVLKNLANHFDAVKDAANDDHSDQTQSGISRKDLAVRRANLENKSQNAQTATDMNNFVQKNYHQIDTDGDGKVSLPEVVDYKNALEREAEMGFNSWTFAEDDIRGARDLIDNYSKIRNEKESISRQDTLDFLLKAENDAK